MVRSLHLKQVRKRHGIIWVPAVSCIALLQILIARGKLSSFRVNFVEDFSFNMPQAEVGHDPGLTATLQKYERQIGQKDSIIASPGPFLVVCDSINPALIPMFSNFTLVRLKRNETPPEWGSVAFLEPHGCESNTYVKEAISRRQQSSFLSAPEISPVENGTWLHGVSSTSLSSFVL